MNPSDLIDIKSISIDPSLDKPERILKYVHAVQNPYQFRVGDTVVNVRYGKGGSLQQSISKLISNNYTG